MEYGTGDNSTYITVTSWFGDEDPARKLSKSYIWKKCVLDNIQRSAAVLGTCHTVANLLTLGLLKSPSLRS